MTKEAMNWNNKIGGKKAERIPCPDGIEGCLVGHYKVIEEQSKQEQGEPKEWVGLTNNELVDLTIKNAGFPILLAQAIEAKLKKKNAF